MTVAKLVLMITQSICFISVSPHETNIFYSFFFVLFVFSVCVCFFSAHLIVGVWSNVKQGISQRKVSRCHFGCPVFYFNTLKILFFFKVVNMKWTPYFVKLSTFDHCWKLYFKSVANGMWRHACPFYPYPRRTSAI